jgi:hypothetical protein
VQLQAILGPLGPVTRCRRDPRDCRSRGVIRRISGLWQRRRERVYLRRAICNFHRLDHHLPRDIGLDSLVLRYGSAGVHPNGRGYQASLESLPYIAE